MLKIFGILFIGLTCIVILKQLKPEYAYLLRLAVTVPAIILLITMIENMLTELIAFESISTAYLSYFKIAIKVLGICYLSQTGSDICKDCGETALSTQVELIGRIATVTVSLPIIKELLEFSMSLIRK